MLMLTYYAWADLESSPWAAAIDFDLKPTGQHECSFHPQKLSPLLPGGTDQITASPMLYVEYQVVKCIPKLFVLIRIQCFLSHGCLWIHYKRRNEGGRR